MAFRSTSTKLMAGVSRSKNFRLTLEQLRIYKKQPKHKVNPCADVMMRLINALEASDVSSMNRIIIGNVVVSERAIVKSTQISLLLLSIILTQQYHFTIHNHEHGIGLISYIMIII